MCIYKVYAFVNNDRYFFTRKLLLGEVKSVVNCGGTNNTVPSNSLSRYVHLQVQSLSWEVHQDQWTFLCHRQSYSFTFGVLQHYAPCFSEICLLQCSILQAIEKCSLLCQNPSRCPSSANTFLYETPSGFCVLCQEANWKSTRGTF